MWSGPNATAALPGAVRTFPTGGRQFAVFILDSEFFRPSYIHRNDFAPKNLSCVNGFSGYVAHMTWQQFLTLVIVLAVAVIFVWRSSGGKKTGCGCNSCGCTHNHDHDHDQTANAKKESTTL